MKRIKIFCFLIVIIISFIGISNLRALDNETIFENFVIYNAKGSRYIFFDMLKSMPNKGWLLINFTSINCKPCIKEIPQLKKLTDQHKDRIKLIYIFSEAGNSVQEFTKSYDILDNTFVDPFGRARAVFKVQSVPVTVIIDKASKLIVRVDGYTQENMKELETVLQNQ